MAFARILRSSALMGGASVATLGAGFLRSKVIAWVAGPAGVGLMGICSGFSGNVATFAGWGLGTAGVRAIAGAPEADHAAKIAAVRAFGRLLAWLGAALTLALFWPVGLMTFGSTEYALDLLIGGLAAPLIIATSMWTAILQSQGRLRQLALTQVATALGGLMLGLPLIGWFGLHGIAPSLLLAAALPAAFTWWQARAVSPAMPAAAAAREDILALVRLGGALMVVGLLSQLAAYAVRLLLIQRLGLEAAGNYQAALSIPGSLPGFVFAAMGTDFFPRVAAAADETEAKGLVEKQIQAGLLLALPLLALLLTMGRTCIHLLYKDDPQFDGAVLVLGWMIWGVYLRVVSWPMGFWLLARGSSWAVIVVEGVASLVMGVLPWCFIGRHGLTGAGMAFFYGYLSYLGLMLLISRRRAGRWIDTFTLGVSAAAGGTLWLAAFVAEWLGGGWAGLAPVALVSLVCGWIYFRALGAERSTEHPADRP
jgi:antigen flippase